MANNALSSNLIPCRFFQIGQCSKGDDCPYLHRKAAHFSSQPCKFYMNGHGFCKHADQCPFSHEKIPNYEPPPLIDIDASIQNELLSSEYETEDLFFQHESSPITNIDSKYSTLSIPTETVSPMPTNPTFRLRPSLNLLTEKTKDPELPLKNSFNTNENMSLNGSSWGVKSGRPQISSLLKKENDDGDDILKDINKSLIVNLFNDSKLKKQSEYQQIVTNEKKRMTYTNMLVTDQATISKKLNISSQIPTLTDVFNTKNNLENRISNLYITKSQEYPLFNILNENNDHLQNINKNINMKNNSTMSNEDNKSTPPTKFKSFLEAAQTSINNNKVNNKVVTKKPDTSNTKIDPKVIENESSNHQQFETKKKLICAFYLEGKCRYKDNCKFIHGNLCQICKKNCLHPDDKEQNNKHIKSCVLKQEIEDSKNLLCNLCNESVLMRGQKFGLLPYCNDIFCVTCIKEYRSSSSKAECPMCYEVSHFIVPSHVYPSNKQRKNEIIESYKEKMRKIPCKYYESGECKFGDNCHYLHNICNDDIIENTIQDNKMK